MRPQLRAIAANARGVPRARDRAIALLVLGLAACTDASTPAPTSPSAASFNRSEGRGIFQRYVALGSGISMGWRSGGLTAESQYESWPAELSRIAHRELDQPYVAEQTCFPPMSTPVGPSVIEPAGPCVTAAGVRLPARNLALRGATVSSALLATVGGGEVNDDGFGFTSVMPLVLSPDVTQVGALSVLRPKIVSVEYGTSELLRSLLPPYMDAPRRIPNFETWAQQYDEILDEVAKSTDVVLLALPSRVPPPGFVRASTLMGSLLAPEMLERFNLVPPPFECDFGVPRFVYAPAYLRLVFSVRTLQCGQLTRSDFSLSFDTYYDMLVPVIGRMREHIREQARLRGFAYFDLEPLYTSYTQPPFSLATFLSSSEPFGPYVSLDGIYPSAAGNRLLAEAAARALNETYDLGLPVSASTVQLEK
jgi:hypothetical protein